MVFASDQISHASQYNASEWLGETLLSVDPIISNQYVVCLPCCSSKLVI